MSTDVQKPSVAEILARVASTSVEDMYRLADEERARLVRINSNLPDKEDGPDNR